MNLSSRGRRSLAALAVVCLVFGAAPTAHAAPWPAFDLVLEAPTFQSWLRGLLARAWAKAGSQIIPDGGSTPANGSGDDLTNAGSHIDPAG